MPLPTPAGSSTPSTGKRIGARLIDLAFVGIILAVLIMLGLGSPEISEGRTLMDRVSGTRVVES